MYNVLNLQSFTGVAIPRITTLNVFRCLYLDFILDFIRLVVHEFKAHNV